MTTADAVVSANLTTVVVRTFPPVNDADVEVGTPRTPN
jgi:hypothetical protein